MLVLNDDDQLTCINMDFKNASLDLNLPDSISTVNKAHEMLLDI